MNVAQSPMDVLIHGEKRPREGDSHARDVARQAGWSQAGTSAAAHRTGVPTAVDRVGRGVGPQVGISAPLGPEVGAQHAGMGESRSQSILWRNIESGMQSQRRFIRGEGEAEPALQVAARGPYSGRGAPAAPNTAEQARDNAVTATQKAPQSSPGAERKDVRVQQGASPAHKEELEGMDPVLRPPAIGTPASSWQATHPGAFPPNVFMPMPGMMPGFPGAYIPHGALMMGQGAPNPPFFMPHMMQQHALASKVPFPTGSAPPSTTSMPAMRSTDMPSSLPGKPNPGSSEHGQPQVHVGAGTGGSQHRFAPGAVPVCGPVFHAPGAHVVATPMKHRCGPTVNLAYIEFASNDGQNKRKIARLVNNLQFDRVVARRRERTRIPWPLFSDVEAVEVRSSKRSRHARSRVRSSGGQFVSKENLTGAGEEAQSHESEHEDCSPGALRTPDALEIAAT